MKSGLLLISRNSFAIALFLLFGFCSQGQNNDYGKIKIKNFQVAKEQTRITLSWSTDSASETNYFIVEKSTDGKNFRTVAYVLGPDPTQHDCECFGFLEKTDRKSKGSYYRLKHINTNGIVQFSDVKMLALK